jgi:hypothetical protein
MDQNLKKLNHVFVSALQLKVKEFWNWCRFSHNSFSLFEKLVRVLLSYSTINREKMSAVKVYG